MNKDILEYIEYLGVYDVWLTYKKKGEYFERHRMNNNKIIKRVQNEKFGDIYFETENGDKFINLTKLQK